MKKLLLIGKLDKMLEELYGNLSEDFQVQISLEIWKIAERILQIVKPDIAVVNIMNLNDVDEHLFQVLEAFNTSMPVIVLTSEETTSNYAVHCLRENVKQLKHPVSKQVLVQTCYEMLEGGQQEAWETDLGFDEVGDSIDWGTSDSDDWDANRQKRILLVDDNPLTLRSMKSMLDKEYQIAVATSGEQALKSMKKERPDLVFLDYEMPGLNGKDTLAIIRQDADLRNTPVIFLTAMADKARIREALALKPQGYFLKPIEGEKLIEAIKKLFGEI